MTGWRERLAPYRSREMLVILLLGFSSGLPLALTGGTLTAWLKESGVDLALIGLFAGAATPYSLKFAWSPLMDGVRLPFFCSLLGRRRGWMLATQLFVLLAVGMLSFIDPAATPWKAVFFFTALVAIASASQDIVVDAYRVEVLAPEQYGAGAAMVTLGYRLGMLVSGAGAFFLADYFQNQHAMAPYERWQATYLIMGALMLVGILTTLFAREPALIVPPDTGAPTHGAAERFLRWVRNSVIMPFADFMTQPGWLGMLLFIALYKLGDAFLGGMTMPFLLEIGFDKSQVGKILKLYGFFATIAGSFIGAGLVRRWGTLHPLWICGAFHALTNLMFLAQAHAGADPGILTLGITLENLTGGMSATVFVAFISSLCHVQYTATQYALLSSLAALGRTLLATPAGWVAKTVGWEIFFLLCVLLAFPSLGVLWWMQKRSIRVRE